MFPCWLLAPLARAPPPPTARRRCLWDRRSTPAKAFASVPSFRFRLREGAPPAGLPCFQPDRLVQWSVRLLPPIPQSQSPVKVSISILASTSTASAGLLARSPLLRNAPSLARRRR